MIPSVVVGTVTGTGAAINVVLGFVPDYVKIVNATDADQIDEWFYGMTAATSVQTNTAVATRASGGVTALDSTTLGQGFTIGASISESAKVLRYVALRSGPGAS